jgi:hypothetical protein
MLTGCKEAAQPQQRTFDYSSQGPEVTLEETGIQSSRNAVHADFNADGLDDYAIIDQDGDGRQVTIYIRKNVPDAPESDPIYYQAGHIRRSLDGNVIGLMSRRGSQYTDLIVLVAREGHPNAMIHYRNDGSSFTEVQ